MQIRGPQKPNDWPINEREVWLDIISEKAVEFRNTPNFKTREVLLALLTEHDLNQGHLLGEVRVTEYEVSIINTLYIIGRVLQVDPLKSYIYNLIGETTRLIKIASWYPETDESYRIRAFEDGLFLPLKLYHLAYQEYTVQKNGSLCEHIINLVESGICQAPEHISEITRSYVSMLYDLSCMIGTKKQGLWEFTRDELKELFALEAKLLKLSNLSPVVRPTKGVLLIQISNFILKSRNDYNQDYICKYMFADTAAQSFTNQQIWMKKTELLNDEREQKVIPELFEDNSWIEYDWVHDIDFTATRTYYVSCFSKSVNNVDMQDEYGQCIYGYKNDWIAATIAPIVIQHFTKRKELADLEDLSERIDRPAFSQVLTFDVIYDKEIAKEELKYLFSIIDSFDISSEGKKSFLEEILQYWILSVKDNKWQKERERRYVIFLYDEYDYKEIERDDTFLKVKTSIFMVSDFVIGDNPVKSFIGRELISKRKALYCREYLFCSDCLMQDHDVVTQNRVSVCPTCGSTRVKIIRE